MYLNTHILRNLRVFEYMKHMLESHLASQKLHLIRTSHRMFCHALQILVRLSLTTVLSLLLTTGHILIARLL